jgi:hypothetical protein
MKYLKKFFEATEFRYVETFEDDEEIIDDIKYLILDVEDLGYEANLWINEYVYFIPPNKEKVTKIQIEFNKLKKVPKEDFNIIIEQLKRLDDYLKRTNFRIIRIDLYDFSKVTTHTNTIKSLDDEITTDLENINTYDIYIKRIED